jgi:hypothetical protein
MGTSFSGLELHAEVTVCTGRFTGGSRDRVVEASKVDDAKKGENKYAEEDDEDCPTATISPDVAASLALLTRRSHRVKDVHRLNGIHDEVGVCSMLGYDPVL